MSSSIYPHLMIAFMVRLGLIQYGEWQDRTLQVKYTDIDYHVFSDAALLVYRGDSPFNRPTYRYTPLLAAMLVPNVFLSQWGKWLFSLFDVAAGYLIFRILRGQKCPHQMALFYSLIWLYIPYSMIIATRGSSDALMCFLVYLTIFSLQRKQFFAGGLIYGFAIHFKIYPVLYVFTFFNSLNNPLLKKSIFKDFFNLSNVRLWKFFIASFLGFLIPTIICYAYYGDRYISEAYLYHLGRKDFRHNFSPFFYLLYLNQPENVHLGPLLSLLTLIPFLFLVTILPFLVLLLPSKNHIRFVNFDSSPETISFCLFIQTFLFVSLNKVCTSQYFLWYLSLLVLLLPHLTLSFKKWMILLGLWISSQALWLFFAYELEFQGSPTFILLWMASLIFLICNVYVANKILCHFKRPFLE